MTSFPAHPFRQAISGVTSSCSRPFFAIGGVGYDSKSLLSALVMLAGDGGWRDYCGRSADAANT
jgi:hypothetical protein